MRERTTLKHYPELLKDWHPTKNEGLIPEEIGAKSKRRVWWRCEIEHEWQAVIGDRTRGTTCPYCTNKKVWKGFNDLASQFPKIAVEFHPTKNEALTPDQVLAGSTKKVWWQCKLGHVWLASPSNRTMQVTQHNCPYCANTRVWPGYNDLTTTHPLLSREWHPTKNRPLTPQEVSFGSDKPVWWQCSREHLWKARVHARTGTKKREGTGCPVCAKETTIKK